MSEFITVARPYAKAAFDFAVEHQSVERWQDMLAFAAEVTKNEQMAELLSGALAPETLAESFIAVCGEQLDENGQNLIRVMAENGRLNALPDVEIHQRGSLEQFIHLRAVSEATAEVDVISAAALSEQQLAKISAAMEKRLSRKVKLNCKIDKSVMAGVIIRAGDMVIDGSVRGRLERLADVLQS
ncbi:ATP synthase subunit delta [Escherichia coli]|uniref:ATP synthase subunit delta n=1 Tax=Escherichia coli TaxID=562 RepID=A0A8S0FFP6_ECOLX|nr:ATP synthase subunit delta [Escherichia coli]